MEHAPEADRETLTAGVRLLCERLNQGLDGYRALVAAAGRVLIASTSAPAGEELTEATERVAGLAAALHELSGDQDP